MPESFTPTDADRASLKRALESMRPQRRRRIGLFVFIAVLLSGLLIISVVFGREGPSPGWTWLQWSALAVVVVSVTQLIKANAAIEGARRKRPLEGYSTLVRSTVDGIEVEEDGYTNIYPWAAITDFVNGGEVIGIEAHRQWRVVPVRAQTPEERGALLAELTARAGSQRPPRVEEGPYRYVLTPDQQRAAVKRVRPWRYPRSSRLRLGLGMFALSIAAFVLGTTSNGKWFLFLAPLALALAGGVRALWRPSTPPEPMFMMFGEELRVVGVRGGAQRPWRAIRGWDDDGTLIVAWDGEFVVPILTTGLDSAVRSRLVERLRNL